MELNKTNNIVQIDVDLVKELRLRKEYLAAQNLVDAHLKSMKQAGLQARKECVLQQRQICAVKGICTACLKNKVMEGYLTCAKCHNRNRNWEKTNLLLKKLRKIKIAKLII